LALGETLGGAAFGECARERPRDENREITKYLGHGLGASAHDMQMNFLGPDRYHRRAWLGTDSKHDGVAAAAADE
jgi:hypothetical protein